MSKIITPDWNRIYSDLSPKILGICRRYIQDIYTAEDIVQDSFITAIQKNNQLKDEEALFAWLKKIVVNNALQHIRKHSRNTFVMTEPSEIPDTYSEMDQHHLEEKNIFIYDFSHEELLSSIDSLPPHHKSVFNLYFIDNHSHAEISNLLGITINTSKSHLLRAKKSVQNYLLNNVVNHNTPKKKITQLLVIAGLGELLWAQTFKSKFSNFSIQPSKDLKIPADLNINNPILSSSNTAWKKKIAIAGIVFIIIAVSVFSLNPKSLFFKTLHGSTIPPDSINENQIETKEKDVKKNKAVPNPGSEKKSIDPDKHQTYSANDRENIIKAQMDREKEILKDKRDSKKIIIKDSIKETTPQKVIIVKKIITRDTIFVER